MLRTITVMLALLLAPALAGCAGFRQNIADFLEEGSPAAGVSLSIENVYFAPGSAQLTAKARRIIREMANTATATDARTVYVTGHSDTVGSTAQNDRLSRARAQAVAAALAMDGVPQDRIVVSWTGEHQPPVPTGDGTAEPANRIVTIRL